MYIICKNSSFFFTFIFHCFLYKDIKKRLLFRRKEVIRSAVNAYLSQFFLKLANG